MNKIPGTTAQYHTLNNPGNHKEILIVKGTKGLYKIECLGGDTVKTLSELSECGVCKNRFLQSFKCNKCSKSNPGQSKSTKQAKKGGALCGGCVHKIYNNEIKDKNRCSFCKNPFYDDRGNKLPIVDLYNLDNLAEERLAQEVSCRLVGFNEEFKLGNWLDYLEKHQSNCNEKDLEEFNRHGQLIEEFDQHGQPIEEYRKPKKNIDQDVAAILDSSTSYDDKSRRLSSRGLTTEEIFSLLGTKTTREPAKISTVNNPDNLNYLDDPVSFQHNDPRHRKTIIAITKSCSSDEIKRLDGRYNFPVLKKYKSSWHMMSDFISRGKVRSLNALLKELKTNINTVEEIKKGIDHTDLTYQRIKETYDSCVSSNHALREMLASTSIPDINYLAFTSFLKSVNSRKGEAFNILLFHTLDDRSGFPDFFKGGKIDNSEATTIKLAEKMLQQGKTFNEILNIAYFELVMVSAFTDLADMLK